MELKNLYKGKHLLNSKIKISLEAKFKEYNDTFNIELADIFSGKIDCKIGHFGYNIYFRTLYYGRYKNTDTLKNSIIKAIAKYNLGLNLEYIVLKFENRKNFYLDREYKF